jgi:hypothetical protein
MMPQSLATPLKSGSPTIKESKMYYITTHKQGAGNMTIWRHVKKLSSFKPEEGVEYVVAKNKKAMKIKMGDTLPVYIGLNGKLKKCSSYALYLF